MSVSNKRPVAGSRSPARSNTKAAAAHRTRMGLLGSTALIAASLACSPAFAQIVVSPGDGGTISRTGGSAPTVNDQSGSGAVLITNVTQATTINVNGVYIDNNTGASVLDALRIEGSTSGLNSTGVTLAGANTLIASMNGGAALYVTTNANMGVVITSSGSFFQGSYGINLQASNGYVDFDASGQSQSFGAIGTHIAGFNAVTSINASIRLGASTFTGFDTGVNVSTPLGAFVELTGGSINALVTGIRADATNGGNTIESQAAIVAPTGIHSTNTNGTTVTTSGAGTINSTVAGSGTGIIATSSGGTNAVNVNVGGAIGTTTAAGVGVLASTTGTSTGAINITTTADIVATGRAISLTRVAFGTAGAINIGGNVTGSTGVYSNIGDYAVNIAQGVTVHGNGTGGSNAGLYLINGAITLINNGTVSYAGTGAGAAAIRLSSPGSVTNAATGLVVGDTGVYFQNNASVINAGAITGTGAANTAGVYGSVGANVTNTGTITGYDGVYSGGNSTTHSNAGGTITGLAHGYNVTGGRLTLTNTGLINTDGGTGGTGLSGLRLNTSSTLVSTINNSGTIAGGGDATHGYGVEIEDGLLTLTNQSGGVITGGIGGILLSSDDLATIDLNLGSTVTGQIRSDDVGARTVTVAGLLDGAYDASTGTGIDTFTLASTGSITGAATFGGGADIFNWQGGTFATLNGGSGTDTFNVALGAGVSGSLDISTLSGFETHYLQSGVLTLTGAGSTSWTSVSGVTFNLAGALTASGMAFFVNNNPASTVNVLAGGSITADTAVTFNGPAAGVFTNEGTVTTTGSALTSVSGAINATNSGSITSSGGSAITYAFGLSNLTNSGTITGGGAGGYAALAQYSGLTVSNTAGKISGVAGGIFSGSLQGATNYGGLLSVTNALNAEISGAVAITTGGSSALTLNNTGRVLGTNGAIAAGGSGLVSITNNAGGQIVSTGDAYVISTATQATITNAGVIGTGTVSSGGAYAFGGSYSAIHTAAAGTIRNSGLIEGQSAGVIADGALDLRNTGTIRSLGLGNGGARDAISVAGTATILNAGLISTDIYSAIVASGANAVVTNAAAGSLEGGSDALFGDAVQLGGANATFNNYGAASSASGRGVLAGDGGTTINLHAGSSTASVETGAGNDTLALYNGRGTAGAATIDAASGITLQNAGVLAAAAVGSINLGGGTDTLQLRGTGDGSAANGAISTLNLNGDPILTAEVLTKLDSGTWTLDGPAAVPGVTINAGAGAPAGLLIFNGTGLTGAINVNGATVRANTTTAFGTGVLHMIDPTIEFAATGTYGNDISLEVANGRQAIDPTILRNISGGDITLAGRIYETNGVGGPDQYVTFDGGDTTILTNTGNLWGGLTAINSGATLQGATNTISGGAISNAGALVFSQAYDGSFGAGISGAGALRVDAPSQAVTLAGTNTYSGLTTIAAGTLIADGGSAIGDASTVDIAGGATLQLANGEVIDGLTGAGTARVLGNTLTVGAGDASTTFSGTITDQTPVAYVGAWVVGDGPAWASNPPTYTGQEAAALLFGGSAGAYRISTAGASTGTITDTAWYNRYGGNPNYVEAANNYRVDTGGAGYNAQQDTSAYVQDHIGDVRTNYAFTGGLALGGGLIKTGTGTLTLTGTNNYTGLTSIIGGTLAVQGGAAISDVSVVSVGSTGVFSVLGSEMIASLTGAGSTTIEVGETLTLAAGSGAYTGAITGGSLSLASGAWIFGGVRSGGDSTGINLTGPSVALTVAGTGSVTGAQYGVFAEAGGSITNQAGGLITGTSLAGVYATGATTLVNAGSITSSGTGGVDAVTIVGVGTITNTGDIRSDANGGSGIAVTGGGSTITNSGVITGSNDGSYGFGVQNAALSGVVTITNQSGGVIGGGMGAILLNGSGDTVIDLQAGSTANGQILSYANGVHTVTVAGALTGVYDASYGSGLDTVTLAASGSMTGAYLGDGADAFIYQGGAFSGLIDGGGGVDAFTSNLGAGNTATLSASDITNFESFAHQSGQLTLTGNAFFGAATVSGGSLLVDGLLFANTLVANGGALGGGGTILGAVTVADGGALNGVQGATLRVDTLALSSGSTINATFSGASGPALFAVNGALTLDGTVNIASSTAYGYGVYGLMTYGGVLTDNGLVIGTTPGGAQRVAIQTSVAGQVNIVHAPTELLFWDGGDVALHDNGAVDGGSGVWTAAGAEWTNVDGLANGAMEPQPGFAVFQNTGGLITVDDVNGAVGVTGMQFAVDGYRVEGDSITLANANTAIRVGDGTAPAAAWTTAIASALTGAGGLAKTDLGTLILTGDSDYTGGTAVEGGRLVVGDGAQAGSFLGSATLANFSTLVFARNDNHAFNNAVSGAGSVVVDGVVTLGGAITVSGGVDVNAGSAATLSDVSVASGPAVSLGANATLMIAADGLVTSGNGPGVFGAAGAAVVNLGGIQGQTIAVQLGAGGSLDNAGSITTANTGEAVYLAGAGTLINRAGGVIAAGGTTNASYGAVIAGVGSVTNSGLISGGFTGVALFGGGTLSNLSGGEIRGVNGVTANAVVSIANAGAITGTTGNALRLVAAGSSITNAGAISAASAFAGVYFDQTGTVTNLAGGSISNTATALQFVGAGSVLDNAGAISNTNTNSAVYFSNAGTVVNQATGTVRSANGYGVQLAGAGSSVANLGSITAGQRGVSLDGANSVLTNAGSISSGNGAVLAAGGVVSNAGAIVGTGGSALGFTNGGLVDNQLNGVIRGATNGVNGAAGSVVVTNAGAITGLNGAGVRLAGGGSVDNLSGGSISGTTAAILSIGAFVDSVTLRDGSTISGLVSLGGGADTLTLHGGASTSGLIDGGADIDAFIVAGTGSSSFDIGNLINFESRTMNGSGTFTLTGVDASTVGWTINAGVLAASGGAAINDAATVSITDDGTLALVNDETIASLTGSGLVDLGASRLTLGAADATTYAGVIRGSGGLTIGAAHGLTLAGANSYTGVTVVDGALTLGASGVLADRSGLLINAAGVVDLQGFDETVGSAFINGVLNGAGTLTAGEYGLNGATINANLGAGNLFNTGGVSMLNGSSGASNVVVQAGTLTLGAANRLADTATVSVAAGSILNLDAFNDTVGLAVINGALDGTGALTAAQYQLNAATVNANLGAGVLFNLGGVSTLNGTAAAAQVSIDAGTLRLGASERLSDTATVSVATGATLDLNGFNERFAALFGTGDVNVGAGRLTVGGAASGFGGRLSGAGSLVHTSGLFALMGDHTIASISNTGGELRFLGATTGGLSVSGGSLTGAGTIGGALTASNGAVLSPGLTGVQNGIGGFSAGSLTLNGATLAIDVLGMSGGNLIDQLRINGAATLTGGLLAPTFQGAATDFDFSTRYLFLQANTLVGTFANGGTFTAATQPGLFWRVRYDLSPNAAVLELREMTDFDPGVTGTGNQRAVGQALSGGQLAASDDWSAILSLIAGLSPADQAAAFDSISGEPLADATTSLFSANDSFLNAVRDGGMSGRDDGGEALNFVDRMSFAGGRDTVADRLGDVLGAFDPSASTARGAGGWVSAYAGDQTLDGKPGQATVESRLNGFAGGYGVRNGSMSVGAAGGVTRLEGDVVSRQGHYESDLSHAAGYVAFDNGVWAADVTASFYGGDLDSRRGVTVGAFNGLAIGNTHVEGQALSASLARRLQLSDNTMIALGALATASNASVDGYTETGAGGLSLQASGMERDWQSLQLSARGTQDYRVNGERFRVYAGAGVMATTGDRQATGDMRFSGAPTGFGTFTVEGAETPPLAGLAEFGLEIGAGEGVTIAAGYRGLFSERLQDNQVGVKLKVSW